MAFTITGDHFTSIAGRTTPFIPAIAGWMEKTTSPNKIDPYQQSALLEQTGHETTRFNALREIGRDRYSANYENRKDHKGKC